MRLLGTVGLAIALMFAQAAYGQQPNKPLKEKVYDSVALLYTQDESGGMHAACTATAYRKIDGGYRFASAAHCVKGDDDDDQKQEKFFLTSDKKNEKNFISANLIEAGDKNAGDDFSIFEVKTAEVFEVTPLGDDSKLISGERVVDVAAPLGLGKQYFEGYVSAPKLDRPAIDADEVKWQNVMLVEIGGGPGSSGSAIVDVQQEAIVGFLVGHFNNAEVGFIVVPVSQFKAFEAKVDAKTYKKKPTKKFIFSLFG